METKYGTIKREGCLIQLYHPTCTFDHMYMSHAIAILSHGVWERSLLKNAQADNRKLCMSRFDHLNNIPGAIIIGNSVLDLHVLIVSISPTGHSPQVHRMVS